MKICKVKNCKRKHNSHGYCSKHGHQIQRHGKLLKRTIYDKNEIIKYSDYAEIILYNRKCEEVARAKIDLDNVEKVKKHKWTIKNTGHVASNKIYLHIFILGKKENFIIDHKNYNPLDNRKQNLRYCTHQQNIMNKPSDGYCFNKINNNWRAYIMVNSKQISLGTHKTRKGAIKARCEGEKKYFKEFAYIR